MKAPIVVANIKLDEMMADLAALQSTVDQIQGQIARTANDNVQIAINKLQVALCLLGL